MKNGAVSLILSAVCSAQNFKVEQTSDQGIPVVHLLDAANAVEVSILPTIGNRAYEMKVHGISRFQTFLKSRKRRGSTASPSWRRGRTGWANKRFGRTANSFRST
jgi:hypothetical protein